MHILELSTKILNIVIAFNIDLTDIILFWCPVEGHEKKVSILQEFLDASMNNFDVDGFNNDVITEMINMLYVE